ncbi:MAG: hypothetical protein F6J97_08770, partial [Leptolyngbya sp. SIO4C1]|nr:hypothetical protein [Leptolyngbya sp. SIO4C1]
MSYEQPDEMPAQSAAVANASVAGQDTAPTWADRLALEKDFPQRHIGPTADEVQQMLEILGFESLAALIDAAVPAGIRLQQPLSLGTGMSEYEALASLRAIAAQNQVCKSYIGLGYHNCITPPVIQRNVLENPGWYTQYTPYQPEIAQGRLEALLNFQTMITDLTGLEIANASLLDEGTAAAEAMSMSWDVCKNKAAKAAKTFWVSSECHPQTVEVGAAHFEYDFGDPTARSAETALGLRTDECGMAMLRTDRYKYVHF